jgi:hypothetical protein
MMISRTAATAWHALQLAPRVREVERAEVMASHGETVLHALMRGIRDSDESTAVYFDGELALIFGIENIPQPNSVLSVRTGGVWMLTTELVEKYPKTFYRACKSEIAELLGRWDILTNAIDIRHNKAIRWATHLGLPLRKPEPIRDGGEPFSWFSVSKEDLTWAHQ